MPSDLNDLDDRLDTGETGSPPASLLDHDRALSGRVTVHRSGEHLARMAMRLRDLEAMILTGPLKPQVDDGRGGPRARLQALDLMIQELVGLSEILIGTAKHLPDNPDQGLDALIDLPRLQTLSLALRQDQVRLQASEVVLF